MDIAGHLKFRFQTGIKFPLMLPRPIPERQDTPERTWPERRRADFRTRRADGDRPRAVGVPYGGSCFSKLVLYTVARAIIHSKSRPTKARLLTVN
jgi:hypothetical protein